MPTTKAPRRLTDDEGEVRPLTDADLARFRPAHEVLPPELAKTLGVRGPQKAPVKQLTSIRFDPDVLAALKTTGRGWQTRVNDAMREWVKAHPPA